MNDKHGSAVILLQRDRREVKQCACKSATSSTAHLLCLNTNRLICCNRFKDMSTDHGGVAKELERANEEFKEFERKDIKYREDLKHLKAKLKKLQEKLVKDSAKMQVCVLTTHTWCR